MTTINEAIDAAANKASELKDAARSAAETGGEAAREAGACGARLAADYLPRVVDLARRSGNTFARAVTTSTDLLADRLEEAAPNKATKASAKHKSRGVVRQSLRFARRRPITTTLGFAALSAAAAFVTRKRTTTPETAPETTADQADDAGQAAAIDQERSANTDEA